MQKERNTMAKKKTTPQPPKVEHNGRQWVIVRRAGTTLQITDGTETVCVLTSKVRAVNNAARAMLK